jgi:hypothetical protein
MESEHAATSVRDSARAGTEPTGDAAQPMLPLQSLEHADPRLRRATVLALQRACGNAAVARLVQRSPRVLARVPGSEIGTTWFEIDQQRRADLEAAETGAGRQTTLARLAAMTDREARREAPGIAFRAQDRGDAELARAATDRLLAAWLASSDGPGTLGGAFGPDDTVDVLLDRAETAFDGGEAELGGALLSVAMVQLVRAARTSVLRRPSTDLQELRGLIEMLSEIHRDEELEIRRRVDRARAMLEQRGRIAAAAGDAAAQRFEAIAEAVHAAERRAGPAIAGDLGQAGPVIAAADASPGSTRRARGSLSGRRDVTPAPATEAPAPAEPPTTAAVRAPETIVDSAHHELEGELVIYATSPMQYGNIRSSRYAVAGTLAGARRLARELFGRRSCVIVADSLARDAAGASEIRYLVLPLSLRVPAPSAEPGPDGVVGIADVQMLPGPTGYRFLCVTAGPWIFFPPALRERITRLDAAEQAELAAGFEPPVLDDAARREAVFGPIDRLIEADELQDAADLLMTIDAQGFALVDVEAKVRYVTALLRAYTYEAHERTVVEVFRSLRDDDELRALLAGLHREGVLGKLRSDLESAFPSLLVTLGRREGASALTTEQALGMLRALIGIDFLGGLIRLNSDGSVTLGGDLVAAVEQLIATLVGTVEGIFDAIADPEAVVKGLWKLVYFLCMVELAGYGHPGASAYVNQVLRAIGAEVGAAVSGLAALQENAPNGDELVRDLRDAIKWRVTWEVLGLFVGVGEATALVEAIRGGRGAAALAEAARGLGGAGRATELAEDAARLGEDAARLGDDAARLGDDAARLGDDAARHADDATRGADDAARHADDATRGADDAARHADGATRGADDAARGADDAARGGGHEPPGGREPPGGGGGGGPNRPRRDPLNDRRGQIHYESSAELREALRREFAGLRSGTAPGDFGERRRLLEEVLSALPDTPANRAMRARIDQVYEIMRDARATENAIVELWEEATRRGMTPRDVLLEKVGAPAGGGGREILPNKVRTSDDGRTTDILDSLEDDEFRIAMRQDAPLRDLEFAEDFHGAYTHMFQEWLIDRALGPGEGRSFRHWLAELDGLPTVRGGRGPREFFAGTWDALFDETSVGHINKPEELGERLWEHGGFPIHDRNAQ